MGGRAVAPTMPAGAWAEGTESGRGSGRGKTAAGSSAVARPAVVAAGRGFFGAPPRRGRRRVTFAASLLFALILVAGELCRI